MLNDWIWFSLFLIAFLLFLFVAEQLRKKNWLSTEATRKLVHILTGIAVFFSPFLIHSKYPPLVLAIIFIIFNLLSIRMNWFSGIHSTDRHSYGTVYYPLAFGILVFFYWESQIYIMQVSMLILALGDAFAAIVGKNVQFKTEFILHHSPKSLEGSSTMFLISFLCVFGCGYFHILPEIPILHLFLLSTVIAFFASLAEALFDGGLDNISIPLISALFLDYILPDVNVVFDVWVISAGILPVIYLFYRLHFLSQGGSVATFILAVIMLGMGGWNWMFPLFIFFLLSSLLSFASHHFRRNSGEIVEKTGARDAIQVLANGGPALIILILAMNNLWPWAYAIFLISVAAATSDTWSTEIGQLFSKGRPFDLFRLKVVEKGISGGMSVSGTFGGLLGSATIASFVFFQNDLYVERPEEMWVLITVCGFLGMISDSFFGSYFQGHYQCSVCGKETEKSAHCGQPGNIIKGYRFINNDAVNFIGISIAVIFGIIGYNLFYKM